METLELSSAREYLKSIDKYYDQLFRKNPCFSDFRQIDKYDNWPNKMSIGFGEIQNRYDSWSSLLYSANTEKLLEFKDGKPQKIVQYKCVFNLVKSIDTHIYNSSERVETGLMPRDKYGRQNFSFCGFYEEFFYMNPNNVETIRCNGEKCRKSISFYEHGIWCESCHGEFDEGAHHLDSILKRSINFREIPKSSIIYIKKKVIEINYQNSYLINELTYLLNQDKKLIKGLMESISQAETKIKDFTQEIMQEKEENEKKLNEFLETRKQSLDQYLNFIEHFENNVQVLKDNYDTMLNMLIHSKNSPFDAIKIFTI